MIVYNRTVQSKGLLLISLSPAPQKRLKFVVLVTTVDSWMPTSRTTSPGLPYLKSKLGHLVCKSEKGKITIHKEPKTINLYDLSVLWHSC